MGVGGGGEEEGRLGVSLQTPCPAPWTPSSPCLSSSCELSAVCQAFLPSKWQQGFEVVIYCYPRLRDGKQFADGHTVQVTKGA